MGYGIEISCGCQRKELFIGVGFCFPAEYQERMAAIKDGKYGIEMKEIANHMELVTVDIESKLYFCSQCGHFEAIEPLDLYAPKDIENARKQIVNRWTSSEPYYEKTVEECGGALPYWLLNDEGKCDYKLIRENIHFCPNCKNQMKKTSPKRLSRQKCPSCGEKYREIENIIFWD